MATKVQPLVSVITVCLNSDKYLEQTIQSVLNQTYDNVEYIIVDGGSSDRTIEIIRKYERSISSWLSEPDEGIYDAMNKGIGMSTGKLVGIINSDDWYNLRALEWVVRESLLKPDADIFHGDMVLVKGEERLKRMVPRGKCVSENLQINIYHPTLFVRREIYEEYKFDCRFRISADRDFIMLLFFAGKTFTYLNKPITYFRVTGVSNRPSIRSFLDRYRIRRRYHKRRAILLLIGEVPLFFDEVVFYYKNRMKKNGFSKDE